MRAAAFAGLAGEVIALVAPRTEADQAGLLTSFLVGFGAAVGPRPHAIADGARHPARLNLVLVGASSRARKGTSWAVIRKVLAHSDPDLISRRLIGGIASGEGLVAELRRREEGDDRNVLVVEPEISRLLRTASRSASLSALLRQAWDGDELAVLTRGKPLRVTAANVSVIGHITSEELRRRLDETEIANGFGNRMLFCWVARSRRLPLGADIPQGELDLLGVRVSDAIEKAKTLGRLSFSDEGRQAWETFYHSVDDNLGGVVGALVARAEAQLLRLAVTYALLDGSALIEAQHVESAEAVWDHCVETVHRVFGDEQPDRVVTVLLTALRSAGPVGLDGSEQRDLFHRHLSGSRLAAAREQLRARGIAQTITVDTGGRPRIVTRLVNAGQTDSSGSDGLWSLSSLPRSPLPSHQTEPEAGAFLGSDNRAVSEVSRDD